MAYLESSTINIFYALCSIAKKKFGSIPSFGGWGGIKT